MASGILLLESAEQMLSDLADASVRGQSLDQLQQSCVVMSTARQQYAAMTLTGSLTRVLEVQAALLEAASSIVDQLCDKAGLPLGSYRTSRLGSIVNQAPLAGRTPAEMLVEAARAKQEHDLTLF